MPAVLPEWAYGHWKSRDVYEHQRDVEDDFDGYLRNRLPLDAIVLDSPWETQYNTWEFNPHQFPNAPGLMGGYASGGTGKYELMVQTSRAASAIDPDLVGATARRAGLQLRRAPAHCVADDGEPYVGSGGWARLAGRLHVGRRRGVVARAGQARARARRGGIKADDGEGWYCPTRPLRRRPLRRRVRWGQAALPALDAARARRGPPGEGVLFGARLDRPPGDRRHLGRRPAVGLWSLRTLVAATLTARPRDLELVARRRRLPRRAADGALPEGCCCGGCSSAASRR
jgi:hypothetical protein